MRFANRAIGVVFGSLILILSACASSTAQRTGQSATATAVITAPATVVSPVVLNHTYHAVAPGPQCDPHGGWGINGNTTIQCLATGAKVSYGPVTPVGGAAPVSTILFESTLGDLGNYSTILPTTFTAAVTLQSFSDSLTCAGLVVGSTYETICGTGAYATYQNSGGTPTGKVPQSARYTLTVQVTAAAIICAVNGKVVSIFPNASENDFHISLLIVGNNAGGSAIFSDFQFTPPAN